MITHCVSLRLHREGTQLPVGRATRKLENREKRGFWHYEQVLEEPGEILPQELFSSGSVYMG